jgi:hypothetical protein
MNKMTPPGPFRIGDVVVIGGVPVGIGSAMSALPAELVMNEKETDHG